MNFFKKRSKIKYYRWYWYRGIPFVVAEVINPEYEKLKEIKPEPSTLITMYNKEGDWYILEHPLYWFFGIGIGRWNDWCFYDSLHMEHTRMEDEQRWMSMVDRAHYDIDNLYNQLNPLTHARRFIRGCKSRLSKRTKKEETENQSEHSSQT